MPVETPSIFSRVIQEHLELKRRNAELEGDMPLSSYEAEDPFENHPLFKSEQQLVSRRRWTEPSAPSCVAGAVAPWPGEDTLRARSRGPRRQPLGSLARLRLGRLGAGDRPGFPHEPSPPGTP